MNYRLKGDFRGKYLFFVCFLSENECLDGMEPVYIYIYIFFFISETQTPSYRAFYILHFLRELIHFRYRRGMPWRHREIAAEHPLLCRQAIQVTAMSATSGLTLPKWKSGVYMLSLPLRWLTVVTREKARVAASTGLETVWKWLNCVAV